MYENRAYEMDIRRDRINAWKEGFIEGFTKSYKETFIENYCETYKKIVREGCENAGQVNLEQAFLRLIEGTSSETLLEEGMNPVLAERAQSMYDAAQKKFSES